MVNKPTSGSYSNRYELSDGVRRRHSHRVSRLSYLDRVNRWAMNAIRCPAPARFFLIINPTKYQLCERTDGHSFVQSCECAEASRTTMSRPSRNVSSHDA